MYFNFLKNHIVEVGDEDHFNWNTATNVFVRSGHITPSEIAKEEQRLEAVGYQFPPELKDFWSQIGCGYMCSNFLSDNVIEGPKAILDVYFSEGEWKQVKSTFNLFDEDELPFFRTTDFNYITIGLNKTGNLGKIYLNGDEIASSLSDFIQKLLRNPIYYQQLQLIV